MFAAFLTTLLFSLSGVTARRTSAALGGVRANFWRILVATAMLGLWAHAWGHGATGAGQGWFFLSGLAGFGLGDVAFYQALPRLGSRLAILLVHCVAVPLASAIEWFWLGTPVTSIEMFAAGVVLAGVALALAPGGSPGVAGGHGREWWIGAAWGCAAAVGQGMGAVLSRRAYAALTAAQEPMDGLTAAYQRILGGVLVAVAALLVVKLRERWTRPAGATPQFPSRTTWCWLVANALAGPTLGVGCYQWALAEKGTAVVLPIVALTPVVIIPFAYFLDGERPSRRSLAGGLIAVAGAVALRMSQ